MKSDYEIIKKKYGEKFAKLVRTLFPTILEQPEKLVEILEANFAPSHMLYDDLIESGNVENFKAYIMKKFIGTEDKPVQEDIETPEELFDKAGYVLYRCEDNDDVQSYKHYYQHKEQLCTFRDPNRIKNYHIFWAVKKDVDKIKRNDFKTPRRQDAYGTSVISLQFSKGENCNLSIKNRYNHTVENPDATFSNDLENIYPGLTDSFEVHYGIKIGNKTDNFELKSYTMANDGKYYKYNLEVDNVYYCPNNIIIDNGKVIELDKSRYEVFDNFIFDKKERVIGKYNPHSIVNTDKNDNSDGMIPWFRGNGIGKIQTENGKNGSRIITITHMDNTTTSLELDKNNRIIGFSTTSDQTIERNFMSCSANVKYFYAPNVKIVSDNFLRFARNIEDVNFENVESVGKFFIETSNKLEKFIAPKLKYAGMYFLSDCFALKEVDLRSLEGLEERSLYTNELESLELPSVKHIGDSVLTNAQNLKYLDIDNARDVGIWFLGINKKLEQIKASNLENIDSMFIPYGGNLKSIDLPKAKVIKTSFMGGAKTLEEVNLPNVEHIGNNFLYGNQYVLEINLPNVKTIGDYFMAENWNLQTVNIPNVKKIGDRFMYENKYAREIELENCESVGSDFMSGNTGNLVSFRAPKLVNVGDNFMVNQPNLKVFDAENLKRVPSHSEQSNNFLRKSKRLKFFNTRLKNDMKYKNRKLKKFIRKTEKESVVEEREI